MYENDKYSGIWAIVVILTTIIGIIAIPLLALLR